MLSAIASYSFLQNALFASVLASVICGVVGVIVVEKRMLMMTGGIAHTAYGGVGFGYLLGFEPMIGAGIFSVIAALIIGRIKRREGALTDITISLLWAFGMALGIAFTGLMPSYPPDMNSYLFGNILSVTRVDLYIMLPLTLLVLLVMITFFNDFKAFLFDARFSATAGINTAFLEYTLLILTALSVVILIRVVGIILAIALITAPAACAARLVKSLKGRMLTAAVLCFAFCFFGLTASYYLSIQSGATIVFISVLTYFVLLMVGRLKKHIKR